jgi:amidohydrolase
MEFMDKNFAEWLIRVRRDFHMQPETLFEEVRTTERIKALLNELGIEHHGFEDMTGVVGLVRGSQPGKAIGLRADIDALPVQELNELPYISRHEGRMHACGHDAHTAIMLGVAKQITESSLSEQIKGNVKFLFQPAEEGGGGARKMIEHGVLENPHVDLVVAGHMGPDMEVGTVGIYSAQSHASADRFRLIIRGKGGHGGRPHQTIDPIVAGAHFVTALQSVVGRNIDPIDGAVITVAKFRAGEAENVIPEYAELAGTIRALVQPVRQKVWQRIREISCGIENTFGVKCDLELIEGYPACTNDEEVSHFLHQISSDLLGPDKVEYIPPTTGAEDFAYFSLERPSAIIRLGCGNQTKGIVHPLHSPYFDLDEEVLSVGVRIFAEAVRRFLS